MEKRVSRIKGVAGLAQLIASDDPHSAGRLNLLCPKPVSRHTVAPCHTGIGETEPSAHCGKRDYVEIDAAWCSETFRITPLQTQSLPASRPGLSTLMMLRFSVRGSGFDRWCGTAAKWRADIRDKVASAKRRRAQVLGQSRMSTDNSEKNLTRSLCSASFAGALRSGAKSPC